MIGYFTICSANYIAHALTLAKSLSAADPGRKLHVFLADRLPPGLVVADPNVVLIEIDVLAIDLEDMTFGYSILELNTAVKPFCFDHMFDALGCRAAVYLDADILVLSPFDHVHAAFDEGIACVLTPHITEKLDDGGHPDEDTFLSVGVFNLGFAAFANVPEARSFLRWWGGKTRRSCIVALDRGIFVDQSYCDLAPCFIEAFRSLRHPGYNVAYWNLGERQVTQQGGRYFARGERIRFMHFSGIEPNDPSSFSKHQNRFTRGNIGVVADLARHYLAELDRHDRHPGGCYSDIPYAFGRFRDGRPIPDVLRQVYRQYRDAVPEGCSPFDLDPDFFLRPARACGSPWGKLVTRLHATVWQIRSDLQRQFDIGTPKGQADLVAWGSSGLTRDYGIGPPYVQGAAVREDKPGPDGWRPRSRDELLDRALTSRSFMIRNLIRRQVRGKERARAYWEQRLTGSGPAARSTPEAPVLSTGLHVFGYFTAETGVGQAARGLVQALRETAVRFDCHTLSSSGFANTEPFDDTASDTIFDTALICANADMVVDLDRHIAPCRLTGRRALTHWAWELPVFPAAWAGALDRVDEVWTASRFVARTVAAATPKPVRVVPYVVRASDMPAAEARAALDLPQHAFAFLTAFDLASFAGRKNPLAVVRAFKAAFPRGGPSAPILIVKYHGRADETEARRALRETIGDDPRIVEIDAVYSGAQMAQLRAACDVFVSLHRSEGFGLNIAEAMAAGKLAIATHFSGNEDFMTPENSVPVAYRMAAVPRGAYPYGQGQWWAEPDHDAAVAAMRWAVANPGAAARRAMHGMAEIRAAYSAAAIARIVEEALAGRSVIRID